MTECDCCGVGVTTTGYLGGNIVCNTCARHKREGNTAELQKRINRYGGGEKYNGNIQELIYD